MAGRSHTRQCAPLHGRLLLRLCFDHDPDTSGPLSVSFKGAAATVPICLREAMMFFLVVRLRRSKVSGYSSCRTSSWFTVVTRFYSPPLSSHRICSGPAIRPRLFHLDILFALTHTTTSTPLALGGAVAEALGRRHDQRLLAFLAGDPGSLRYPLGRPLPPRCSYPPSR